MADSDEQKACGHSRHTAWWGQVVFSGVALAAHLTAVDKDLATRIDKWTASVQCVSVGLALIALLAYRVREEQFAGKLVEGGLALVVLGIWAAGIPAMMNPDNGQAVDELGGIENANLYFSVWTCLFIAVWTFGSYVTEKHLDHDLFAVDASTPLGKWYILCAASVVMTASSTRLFMSDIFDTLCVDGSEDICMRTKFAISTGAVGTFFALVASMLGSRGMLKTYPEAGMALVLFGMYTTAIALVTFGGEEKAPALNIGNLYFSTWIGFGLAAFLVSKSVQNVNRLRKGGGGEPEAKAEVSEPKEEQQEEEANKSDEGVDKKDEEAQQAPPEGPLEAKVTSDEFLEQEA